ncbi:hypothetical protein K1719_015931 [Acacia pycnantha]|nr:hypothetical protein K1719_015931 [Acacia pycnantha]
MNIYFETPRLKLGQQVQAVHVCPDVEWVGEEREREAIKRWDPREGYEAEHHYPSPPSSELLAVVDLVLAVVLPSIFFSAVFFAAAVVLPSSPQPFCLISTLRSVLFDRLSDEGLETSHFQFQS